MFLFLLLLILCQNGFCIPSVLSIQDSYTAAVKSAIEVKTLLCIGDSITKGDGSSDPFYNYPSQLSRLLNGDTSHNGVQFDVINLGISFIC
jgi:lysophospholipase L1-like esterase